MLRTLLIFFTIASVHAIAVGQTIALTCKATMDTYMARLTMLLLTQSQKDLCEKSKKQYTHMNVYIFEKESLKDNGNKIAELRSSTCWRPEELSRIEFRTTPKTIIFPDQKRTTFYVDRENLTGGFEGYRQDWTCEISEIITKNKL